MTTSPRAATPMVYARQMVERLVQQGLETEAILEEAQIRPDQLENVQARITAAQMELLSMRCMQALDDEALGWFERPLPWGSYGMLARASLTAPTLAIALKRWARHHGLLTHAVHLNVDAGNSRRSAQITLDTPGVPVASTEFCVVTLLRNMLGFASWVVDSRIAVQHLSLAFARPAHAEAYAVLFPCPVEFDAPRNCMDIDPGYLQLSPCRSEAEARTMLQRALPLTVHHYRRDRLLVEQVRLLLTQQPQAMRDARTVAHTLAMSERSLHRQLAAEGARWQSLKNEARLQVAEHLLRTSDKPLKSIAQAAGFDNDKSFIRAFKQWTGTTPEIRRRSK